jgi:hypothetical protein
MIARRKQKPKNMAEGADKYALYRLSVQDPEHEVDTFQQFYRDAYARNATTLREDFCAAAAVCVEWVRASRNAHATGVDLDPEPLAYGRANYLSTLDDDQRSRVTLLREDVLKTKVKAEIIAAQNYSFFLFKQRAQVRDYFAKVHASLDDDGLFIMDMMGGGAMLNDAIEESRQVARPTREDKQKHPPFRYVWEERSFNPITHDAFFAIHFRFPDGSELKDAFTYDWRLWTIPEVTEMLAEAGFSESHVYWETVDKNGDASGKYRRETKGRPDPAWLAYVVALK